MSSSDSKSVTLTIENTTCTVTLNGGTGVDKIYYCQGTSGNWTQYSAAFTVNPGTTVQYYSTPKTNYASDQTQSNPGSVTVNANKTITLTAKLTGGDISGATVTVSPTSATYTGSVIENPTVTVTLNGTDITSHCRCTWDDTLKNLGVYHLTVTARQDEPGYTFTGTATAHPTFTIKSANMPTLKGKAWKHDVQDGRWAATTSWEGGEVPTTTLGEFRNLDDKTLVKVDAAATVKGIKFYNTAPLTMHITNKLTVNGEELESAEGYLSSGTITAGSGSYSYINYRSAPVTLVFSGSSAQLYLSPKNNNYAMYFGCDSVAGSGNESKLTFVVPQNGWSSMTGAAIAVDEAKNDSPTIISADAYFEVDATQMVDNQASYLFYSVDGARIYKFNANGSFDHKLLSAEIQTWTKSDRFIITTPKDRRGVVDFVNASGNPAGEDEKAVAMRLTLVPATDIANAVVTLNKGAASYTGSAVEKPTLVSVTLGGVDITDQCYISRWKNAAGEEVNNLIAAGEYYPVVRAKLSSEEYCGVVANPPTFRIVSAYYHKSGTTDWTTVSGWYMNEALTQAATAYPDNYDAGVFVYSGGSAVNAVSGGTTTSRKVKLVSLKGGSGDSSLAAVYSTKLLAKLDEDSEVVSCETGVTALHDVRFEIDSGSASGATPSIEVKSGATLYADSMSAGNVKLELAAGSTLRLFPGLSSYGAGSGTTSSFGSFTGGAAGQTTTVKVENNTATFSGASGVSGNLDLQLKPGANNTTANTMLTIGGAFTVGSGSTLKVDASGKTTAGTYPLVRATSFGGMTAAQLAGAATVTATASGKAAKVVATSNGNGLDLVVYDPTVTLNKQGGTGGLSSVTVTYGSAMPSATMPTRTGYTFLGYFDATSGGTKYYNANGTSAKAWDKMATTTLYAQWTANEYTITVSGGGSASPTKYTYNPSAATSVTMTPTTKTGYTFSNWTVSGASGATPTVSGNTVSITKGTYGNLTVTANWTANTYNISYSLDGGTNASGNPTTGTFNANVTVKVPTKTGYTFAGWKVGGTDFYTSAKWGTSSSPNTGITKDTTVCVNGPTGDVYFKNLSSAASGAVTLTATWTANTYTVVYIGNGKTGGSTASSSHTYDTAKQLTANGYERKHTVTLDANTGSCGTSSLTSTYTFNGWNTKDDGSGTSYADKQSVSNLSSTQGATVNLYAKWTAASVTLPTPTKTGYTCTGWFTATSGGTKRAAAGGSYTPKASETLYAQWSAVSYTITVDQNSGTGGGINTATYTISGSAQTRTMTNPTRTGYTFSGWTVSSAPTSGTPTVSGTTLTIPANAYGNFTVKANWTAKTYTVTLDSQGATISGSTSVTATYGAAMPTATMPTRSNYIFGGYFTEVNGGGTKYYNADGTSAKNWDKTSATTLYAKWTGKTYTITLSDQIGTGGQTGSFTVTVGTKAPNISPLPKADGYVFCGYGVNAGYGWYAYYNADGTPAGEMNPVRIVNDWTLHAIWRKMVAVPTAATGLVYDGTSKTGVASGTGYLVTGGSAVNAGTYTATVSLKAPTDDEEAKGIEKYIWASDKTTANKTVDFTIAKKDISSLTAFVPYNPEYTGSAIGEGVCSLEWTGGPALTKGTDYTVEIVNNVNVGTATVTFKGKGDNYTGEKVETFDIQPATISAVTLASNSTTYDGSAHQPTVSKVTANSKDFTDAATGWTVTYSRKSDFSETTTDFTSAGTIYVKVTGKTNLSGSVTKSFSITAKDIADVEVSDLKYYYDAAAHVPTLTPALTWKTDFTAAINRKNYSTTFEWDDMKSAYTYVITLTGIGNYTGTKSFEFVIASASYTWKSSSGTSGTGSWTDDSWTRPSDINTVPNGTAIYTTVYPSKNIHYATLTADSGKTIDLGIENAVQTVANLQDNGLGQARVHDGTLKVGGVYKTKATDGVPLIFENVTFESTSSTSVRDVRGQCSNAKIVFRGANTIGRAVGSHPVQLRYYSTSSAILENLSFVVENGKTTAYQPVYVDNYGPRTAMLEVGNATFDGNSLADTSNVALALKVTLGENNTSSDTTAPLRFLIGDKKLELTANSGSTLTVDASAKDAGTYPLVRAGTLTVADGLDAWLAAQQANVTAKSGTTATLVKNGANGIDLVVREKVAKPTVNNLVYSGVSQTVATAKTGYTLTGNTGTNVNTYTLTATLSDGYCWEDDGSTDDYSVDWKITPATLTATADNKSVTYGDAAPTYTVTVTGFVNGETAATAAGYTAPTATSTYTTKTGAGSVSITVTGGAADNYTFSYTPGTLTVNKREISIKWTDTTFVYDGQPHKPTATAGNVVNSDTVALTVSGEQTEVGGPYTATAAFSTTQTNYELPSDKTTTFTITKPVYTVNGDKQIEVDPTEMKKLFGDTVSSWQTALTTANANGVPGWEAYVLGMNGEDEWQSLTKTMIIEQGAESTPAREHPTFRMSDSAKLAAATQRLVTAGGQPGVSAVKYELVGKTPSGTYAAVSTSELGDGQGNPRLTPAFIYNLSKMNVDVRFFMIRRVYEFANQAQ